MIYKRYFGTQSIPYDLQEHLLHIGLKNDGMTQVTIVHFYDRLTYAVQKMILQSHILNEILNHLFKPSIPTAIINAD